MNLNSDSVFKKIIKIIAAIAMVGLVVIAFCYTAFITIFIMFSNFTPKMIYDHFAVIAGLPFIALLSFFIVITLESSFGTIEFEGLGFKFKGASGPIVFWMLCFLTISMTIKMLW